MSRLSNLYQAIKTLANEGVNVSPELETQLRKAEEEIIQKEILPVMAEKVEPVLSQIERELVLVVDYLPGSPIKVSLSRRRNIRDILKDAVDILPDPIVEHSELSSPRNKKKSVGPRKKLRVTFPDGTIIQENEACETLKRAIEKIGVLRVRGVGLIANRIPLVSNRKDQKYAYAQHELSNGWFLMTCSSTPQKKDQLDKIAKALHLNIRTEVIA